MKETRFTSNLRLPAEVFVKIDEQRKALPGKVSRNTWISQAVIEKLERDEKARRGDSR